MDACTIRILPDGTAENLPTLSAEQKLAILLGVPVHLAAKEAARRIVKEIAENTTGKPA